MSDFATILGKVRTNLLEAGVRHARVSTTSAGAADGTTMISASLAELDDSWNNVDCIIITGDAALNGLKKTVEDFTDSNDTLMFTNNAWPKQVGSGVTFELAEKGIWAADDLRKIVEQAANLFLRKARDLNVNYTMRESISSTNGVANLPANVLKFVEPIVKIDNKVAAIISPDRAAAFDDDAFIDATNGDPIAYFWGRSPSSSNVGKLIHKPATNATCVFNYVPVAVIDTSGNWKVDEAAWDPIVMIATGMALQVNERTDLGDSWIRQGFGFIEPKKAEKLKVDA